jgi:exopolysaccharide biosynthesis polyprenyl glycosylphosphotransferase
VLRERAEFVRNILYALDLLVVSLHFFALYAFILHYHKFSFVDFFPSVDVVRIPASPNQYMQAYWLAFVIWAVLLKKRGEYHYLRLQTYEKVFSAYIINGFLFFVFFTSFAFLLKFDFLSRMFILIYTGSSVLWLLLNRVLVLAAAHMVRSRGYNVHNILIVGTGRRAQEFLSLALRHKEWGYRIVGFLDKDPRMMEKGVSGYPVLGTLDDFPRILERTVIDEVVFVVPRAWLPVIEKCILYCEAVGVPATLATDFFDLEIASGVPKELDGFTYLTFETSRLKETELVIKRTIDITASSILLLLSLPMFAVLAALIRMDSKGPIFFKQTRSGLNGRRFSLYKFRSMIANAESRLEELKTKNEMTGPVFKMTDDPRLTRVGKFLRKTSLDEFPQFWNVLKGDMSLVGPRPPLPKEVEQYEPWQRRRLSMKPGITCIWQVSGRNKIGFEDWMKLDLQYIDRWSLWLDLKIMILTFRAVLGATGK